MLRLSFLLALILILTSCSTFLEGPHQEVTITTPGAEGARCQIENHYFRYIINPPRTFRIERTSEPYKVACIAPGNRLLTVSFPPGYEDTAFWNAMNGVIPGFSVDAASGALFQYPNNIVVDFTNVPPSPMPLPAYQQMFIDHPELKGMEEFRAGVPALQRDWGTTGQPMQKRPLEDIYGAAPAASAPAADSAAEAAARAEASAKARQIGTTGMSADALNRTMNPDVFKGSGASGFVGGTAPSSATDSPVTIYPLQ